MESAEVISTDDALSKVDAFNRKQMQAMHCKDVLEPCEPCDPNNSIDDTNQYIFADVLDEVLGDDWRKECVTQYHTDDEEFCEDDEELDKAYEERKRQTDDFFIVGSDVIQLYPRITHQLSGGLCQKVCPL